MVVIAGIDIDPAFIAIILVMLLFLGTLSFGLESRNKGIRLKRQRESFDLLLKKEVIIEATHIRDLQATPSSHIAKLKEVVNLTKSASENLQDARLVICQSQVGERVISQLGKIVDELGSENGSALFGKMSKIGERELGTLEQYGIASVQDVKKLHADIKEYYSSRQEQPE